MGRRHVISEGGIGSRPERSLMFSYPLKVIEDLHCFFIILNFYMMADIAMGNAVIVPVHT